MGGDTYIHDNRRRSVQAPGRPMTTHGHGDHTDTQHMSDSRPATGTCRMEERYG
jgi:hypothetical protein